MISRLPKWVEVGALVLALIAGFINAIGLLSFEHQSVSHLSGTATLLGVSLLEGSYITILHLVGTLLCFVIGSAIAGFLLHGSTLKLGRHYDTALFLESLLLFLAFAFLTNNLSFGHFFASAACGLQNALATTYSGAVVRTTHVTGLFTDLGIMVGSILRGEKLDRRKSKLFLLIIIGFVVGGTLGALSYAHFNSYSLLIPAGFCFVVAEVYRQFNRDSKRAKSS
ncbi:YoaK family protein [Vibrio hippocampi]|uniref:DUF1275 domain-containing protein n=1 Tax=Vibrio hippocampi TaxID=654686 RepID=A0ABM8ZFY2_9VIBR|nr:YoaK family protein [Vibrio hippocampi]CAH0524323.1 hypothetical protein VHP8226_00137 [Vibrio hippocampi]